MDITRKELNEYSLATLRLLGAKIGVQSPTTLKKEMLISEILLLKDNHIEPFFSKVGRPIKPSLALPDELENLCAVINKAQESAKDEKLQELKKELKDIAWRLNALICKL